MRCLDVPKPIFRRFWYVSLFVKKMNWNEKLRFLQIFGFFTKQGKNFKNFNFLWISSKILINLYCSNIACMASNEMFGRLPAHFWVILIYIIICWKNQFKWKFFIFCSFLIFHEASQNFRFLAKIFRFFLRPIWPIGIIYGIKYCLWDPKNTFLSKFDI